MYKSALLFLEIYMSQMELTRRRSRELFEPGDLLVEIFKNVDDPESFYGVTQESSLLAVMDRLEYEKDGFKALSFRGAHLESRMRQAIALDKADPRGIVQALHTLDLNGVSHSILREQPSESASSAYMDNVYQSARKLEQWDLPISSTIKTEAATVFRALQSVNTLSDQSSILQSVDSALYDTIKRMTEETHTGLSLQESLRTLAVLTEIDEVLNAGDAPQLDEVWEGMVSRNKWMPIGRYDCYYLRWDSTKC
jgi:ataxia telangiectasia mutated family protein